MLGQPSGVFRFLRFLALILMIGSLSLSVRASPPDPPRPHRGTVDDFTISTGRAPIAPNRGRTRSADSTSALVAGTAAFLMELAPANLRYLPEAGLPGEWLHVGDESGSRYYAGDFVGNDFSKLYVIDFDLNELHTLDTADGTRTTIGACLPLAGHVWTGATGTAEGVLYASSNDEVGSYLYTVDTATGAATAVGQITNGPVIIDIAINDDGEMYGLDISADTLVRIDPATGAGTVIGSIGFDANYAQGMDFEYGSDVLYLAAFNDVAFRGELRTANTSTGSTTLVGVFPDNAEVDALAFTPPPTQVVQNPGFEDQWAFWQAEGTPFLSSTSHTGSRSVHLSGEECWVWQLVYIPPDAIDLTLGYWFTGVSADQEWDNDIICWGLWDLTRQTEYASKCFGMTYFYSDPMTWKRRILRLNANELASVAGKTVVAAVRLTQDWNPGYHKVSDAYVDDTMVTVTQPIYGHAVYLPLIVR